MERWHIFFISGVAGAGKWTVIKWLLKDDSLNLELVLSCKTREPREWEIPGLDYVKLSIPEFKKAIENNEFLEYNFVHNQAYYWTRYEDVINNWILKWKNILKEVDILILPKIFEEWKVSRDDFTYIFIDIPLEMIAERMKDRWDDIDGKDYRNRIESAKKEKLIIHLADYVIDWTKSIEEVLEEVRGIVKGKIKD
jgi:guanylate kinase